MSAPVDVDGGAGGITANRASIEQVATLHAHASAELWADTRSLEHEVAALGVGMLTGDYGEVGGRDAAGLAAAQSLLGDAVTRLQRSRADLGGLATKLRNAVRGFPWGTDAFGATAGKVEGLLIVPGRFGLLGVPGLVQAGHAAGRRPTVAGLDPRTVDAVIDAGGVAALAELVSGDGDGLGVAIATGTAAVTAPRRLTDLVDGLGEVNRTGTAGGIDVRVITDAQGHRRVVVDITGTRVWTPGGRNVADLTTNARALAGHNTAYSAGVVAALRQAGVRRGEPIMLVGHSQGGMVAVNTASELARTGEFTVTHVITAGAPISLTVGRLPSSIRVLALENSRDVVPRIDGVRNPDRRSVTTVSGNYGDGSVSDSHSIESSYRPLAAAAERTGGRSVREFLTSAGGFFDGVRAEQHRYRVERR